MRSVPRCCIPTVNCNAYSLVDIETALLSPVKTMKRGVMSFKKLSPSYVTGYYCKERTNELYLRNISSLTLFAMIPDVTHCHFGYIPYSRNINHNFITAEKCSLFNYAILMLLTTTTLSTYTLGYFQSILHSLLHGNSQLTLFKNIR